MALGNFNVSLLFWLFIILLFVSEYFSEISFHVSEKCLIPSYPILMKFYFNFIKNVILSTFYISSCNLERLTLFNYYFNMRFNDIFPFFDIKLHFLRMLFYQYGGNDLSKTINPYYTKFSGFILISISYLNAQINMGVYVNFKPK